MALAGLVWFGLGMCRPSEDLAVICVGLVEFGLGICRPNEDWPGCMLA